MSYLNEDDDGYDGDETGCRPAYTTRHPPLVQPLRLSSFSEHTRTKYAVQDLAHEWVALFQCVGSGGYLAHRHGGGPSTQRAMKMDILDTVLMSPTGQPSVWYRTTASRHIKARQLASVTPRAILKAFQGEDVNAPCALVRKGFQVLVLNGSQLQELCQSMESACLSATPRDRESIGDDDDDDDDMADGDNSDSGVSEGHASPNCMANVFCVQKYVEKAQDVSFLCLWKRIAVETSPTRRRDSDATIPSLDGKPRIRAMDEIYLLQSRLRSNTAARSSSIGESYDEGSDISLSKLGFGEKEDVRTRKQLDELGFDAEATLPLLLQMKLLTSEIVSRINRACGSSRQVTKLACEFILAPGIRSPSKRTLVATDPLEVVFVSLAGIEWHGQVASWEILRHADPISKAIVDCCSQVDKGERERSRNKRVDATALAARLNLSLALFDELNPRFPSVQSPLVSEKQWKNKSALLPPYVSPRYVDAETPKQYRDGQFSPLLSPRQSDSVNRLNLPFRSEPSPYAPRHPLSKKNAEVERELWARREAEQGHAVFLPRSPIKLGSPKRVSPRHRHSLIKEELL